MQKPAAGFVVTFENGYTVYFTGSSAATQDMALWAEAYKPDAMIFLMAPNSEPRCSCTSSSWSVPKASTPSSR